MSETKVYFVLLVFFVLQLSYIRCKLLQVHVAFRHGERTTDSYNGYGTFLKVLYPNETYEPYGYGQLTNAGKQREYWIGKMLRARYEGFLEKLYTPDLLDAVTTDTSRTKMSLQLVCAGLFEPQNTAMEWENNLNWQPIPYNYLPIDSDRVLGIPFYNCKNYIKTYEAYLKTPKGIKSQEKYKDLFKYLTFHLGEPVNRTLNISNIYFQLVTQKEWGLNLPPWADSIFSRMKETIIDQYSINSATIKLKQLSGGYFVKKIINDMNLKAAGNLVPNRRKIFLYSCHEINIAYILNAMEVYYPHIPPYGAYIVIELHEINGVFGVKIFYQDYYSVEPKLMEIPGCGAFCPLKDFGELLQENLPIDDKMCG